MNPFATFDCLTICAELKRTVGNATNIELHLFSYLSCLLSLYERRPASDWGYNFAGTKYGAPYSHAIEDTAQQLIGSGMVSEIGDSTLVISEFGTTELHELSTLSQNIDRIRFLTGACASTLALPLGSIREAIASDPAIHQAVKMQSVRPLLESSGLESLHDQFAALSSAIGVEVTDLMVPAVLWLTYLTKANQPSLTNTRC